MTDGPRTKQAPALLLRDLRVRYPFAAKDAVGPISLTIERGERVLLLGPSGSGKSTLLQACTGLIPRQQAADVSGEILLFGEEVGARSTPGWARRVAQFFQDAELTLCGMLVEDEIAFALENRGLPEEEIFRRVAAIMAALKLPPEWRSRQSAKLSGGERQLVALASVMVQEADLFIADEPTANLSPEAAERFQRLLAIPPPGQTILIVDHRFDGLIEHIDRLVALAPDGNIFADGPPREVLREHYPRFRDFGIWTPASAELDARLVDIARAPRLPPLSVSEILSAFSPVADAASSVRSAVAAFLADRTAPLAAPPISPVPMASLEGANCAPFLGRPVLSGIDLALFGGQITGLVGPNGSGKTTLGATLAGVLKLHAGRRHGEPGGIAFQNPDNQFLTFSSADELGANLPQSLSQPERTGRVTRALADWRLSGLEGRHPFELSQGQKRRLALASLTIAERWNLLVLDEPTAGLDAAGAAKLAGYILQLRNSGRAILLITHDMDFAARLCDRLLILAEGRILADGDPAQLFSNTALMAAAGLVPPAHMPARAWLAGAAEQC